MTSCCRRDIAMLLDTLRPSEGSGLLIKVVIMVMMMVVRIVAMMMIVMTSTMMMIVKFIPINGSDLVINQCDPDDISVSDDIEDDSKDMDIDDCKAGDEKHNDENPTQ